MAQFTASQLARLLSNVEREILVDALESAGLTSILPGRHLAILEDTEGNWNTLFNLFLNALLTHTAAELAQTRSNAYPPPLLVPGGPPNPLPFEPTGVLFLDGIAASIRLAIDYFSPLGQIRQLFTDRGINIAEIQQRAGIIEDRGRRIEQALGQVVVAMGKRLGGANLRAVEQSIVDADRVQQEAAQIIFLIVKR